MLHAVPALRYEVRTVYFLTPPLNESRNAKVTKSLITCCSSVSPRATPQTGLTCCMSLFERVPPQPSSANPRLASISIVPVVETGNAVEYAELSMWRAIYMHDRCTRDRWTYCLTGEQRVLLWWFALDVVHKSTRLVPCCLFFLFSAASSGRCSHFGNVSSKPPMLRQGAFHTSIPACVMDPLRGTGPDSRYASAN